MAQMWRNDLTDLAACEAAAEQRFRPVVRYTLTHQDRPCTDFAVQAEPVLSDETDRFSHNQHSGLGGIFLPPDQLRAVAAMLGALKPICPGATCGELWATPTQPDERLTDDVTARPLTDESLIPLVETRGSL